LENDVENLKKNGKRNLYDDDDELPEEALEANKKIDHLEAEVIVNFPIYKKICIICYHFS
jgi:hypothetical protein